MGGDGAGKGQRSRYAFKALCPNDLIARMLGRGGSRKDQLQDETGCKIVISGRDDYFPGTRWRILIAFSDSPDACLGVLEQLINDIVELSKEKPGLEAEFTDSGQYVFRCVVTKQMSSAIIGPKGANARAIREDSGCKVAVDSNIIGGHQLVKLVGEPRGLRVAIAMVNRHIQDQCGSPAYSDWASVKCFDRSGNPVYMPPAETFGKGERGGQHGHASHTSQEREDRERTPRGQGSARGRAAIPPPASLTSLKQPESEVDAALLDALSQTATAFPPGGLDIEYTITCELPSEKVGLLIGRKGEDVQRIRKSTGTYVHFDPVQDGAEGQTLVIRGPLLQVYRAHALLMRRYHETQAEEAPKNGKVSSSKTGGMGGGADAGMGSTGGGSMGSSMGKSVFSQMSGGGMGGGMGSGGGSKGSGRGSSGKGGGGGTGGKSGGSMGGMGGMAGDGEQRVQELEMQLQQLQQQMQEVKMLRQSSMSPPAPAPPAAAPRKGGKGWKGR
ncbi:unnamed protein product [Effrenium voratum]|uniref:K Homology domain-containing protein n=1 Tax=Effrenium voratum TaxID=2562239 RepID=A0AA36IJ43_9DINO|nr:unnamed protein product [Effrenium voratum]CAJ1447221.1 unnamed protein product [Effrenium voratum]